MKYILILIIFILAGCSTKTEKQLNQIGRELEQIQVLLRNLDQPMMEINKAIRQKMIFQELKKANEQIKKQRQQCKIYMIKVIQYGIMIAEPFCPGGVDIKDSKKTG